MYLFVDSSIRGGLSQNSKSYTKEKSKYMSNNDELLMESYTLCLDANNLYGYTMCAHLPQGNLKQNFKEWKNDKFQVQMRKVKRIFN